MNNFIITIAIYLALQVSVRLLAIACEVKIGEPTVASMATQIFIKVGLLIWACVLIFS